jgi:steroid 5-alpha reductase family enzyme
VTRAIGWIAVAYLFAGAVAVAIAISLPGVHPILVAGAADLSATAAIFAFSLAFRNSSFYDAYWSVAPIPIAFYWWLSAPDSGADPLRAALVLALVSLWGLRLTCNWARGWRGLGHQDWRYTDLQERTGRAYWAVSFLGIHLFPTVMVFLGCLPLYPALAEPLRSFGALDLVAAGVTGTAVWLEATADRQLRRFTTASHPPEEFLRSGLWAWCRHPNYLGEILFWWGLVAFSLAAGVFSWWTAIGAVAITLMFQLVSIPMIDRRMVARRPAYAEHAKRTSALLPRRPSSNGDVVK